VYDSLVGSILWNLDLNDKPIDRRNRELLLSSIPLSTLHLHTTLNPRSTSALQYSKKSIGDTSALPRHQRLTAIDKR